MSEPKLRLERLTLSGFKTIRELDALELGPMNVLIGPNGAGKSNLLSFFRMLSQMFAPPGNLQFFIGKAGGANTQLYGGATTAQEIQALLNFPGVDYQFRLAHAAPDTLIFAEEEISCRPPSDDETNRISWIHWGGGHREAIVLQADNLPFVVGEEALKTFLRECIVHQFHNTSETARIRQRWSVSDGLALKEDAANLAPFLLRIREQRPAHYRRIAETLRQIAPFFADFELVPENDTVLLRWREKGNDLVFGPHQASDGTLRAMALVALLMQPADEMPLIILLDEPELGLHPRAISVLAGLLQTASLHTQVIVATQSPVLLDHFEPEQVIVAEREGSESVFRRLDRFKLESWLEEYTLSDLWDKNVLGGRPR
ncbi:MAG TPA: AAA family ATPase [Longimicrobium sp.]|nr:AAA family ATPase [Longimicrobium sp.]